MSIIITVFIIGILILIHELGHFFAARMVNIPISILSVGFGPKIWCWKKDDTEYYNLTRSLSREFKGSGVSTTADALFMALKYIEKPYGAIIKAINMIGSDTDTIGNFVGSIIGAAYGKEIGLLTRICGSKYYVVRNNISISRVFSVIMRCSYSYCLCPPNSASMEREAKGSEISHPCFAT